MTTPTKQELEAWERAYRACVGYRAWAGISVRTTKCLDTAPQAVYDAGAPIEPPKLTALATTMLKDAAPTAAARLEWVEAELDRLRKEPR